MKRADLTTQTVLEAVRGHFPLAYEHLAQRYPGKVILAAFEREYRKSRLEYGVSEARPFLTPEGWQWLGQSPHEFHATPGALAAFGLT